MRGLELAVRSEADRADARPPARRPEVRRLAEPDHSDTADVPLQQRIHGLRRRESDELDRLALHVLEEGPQRIRDPLRDAVLVRVGGGDRDMGAELAGLRAHGDGLGERPTHIDPDAKLPHAPAASSRRRDSRFQPKR